ncbi:substrate-binding domain-containing protein [Gordonia neofelifaecis]|uniref:Molybdenum ABC transporter periplasmic molybdate-binding protein n=1 Tax=Gordonia neofelifaecis NRRL B-59395 TaxID=644548 RepID=F1YKG3_9ACTN|nr:substrate-binding domain-containing protein [Gordonia neofelifaecis]EGD54849.1 molybdenum ABC transporter periplasmic molybdate-binding protein [Gordonia neofelifaecis NRRL B-59395]
MRTHRSLSRRSAVAALTAFLAASALSGCSDASADRSITVSAPQSLQAVLATIATTFEQQHPGARVTIARSGTTPADVVATDDEAAMDRLGERVIDPRRFASNSLIIVTPLGNPGQLRGFADLARPGLRVATCAVRLPCGSAVARLEKITGVGLSDPIHVDSGEAAVSAVASGRADAALAYQTQTRRGLGVTVDVVDDPVFAKVINRYPIAVSRTSDDNATAEDFVKTVIGPIGGAALATAGFGPPSG